jgi:prepilin-type N-terminal cleavage/methylation domain-containing protein
MSGKCLAGALQRCGRGGTRPSKAYALACNAADGVEPVPPREGFTLIELLFVVLLLGTVMTVIMASFEGGFRVYDRVSAFGIGEMEVYLAGETIARDLKNAIQTGDQALVGEADSITMLTVASTGERAGQLRQVRYQRDASGVQRKESAPPTDDGNPVPDSHEYVLGKGFTFFLRYAGAAAAGAPAGGWSDTWANPSNLPAAVLVEIAGPPLPEGPVLRTVLLETANSGEEP